MNLNITMILNMDFLLKASENSEIPFVLYTKRQIFSYIQNSCGDVCSKLEICHGQIKSWRMPGVQKHLLHKLTYFERLSFLR